MPGSRRGLPATRVAGVALSGTVYEELRRIAVQQLTHERRGHALEPRDLVHEACLRLLAQARVAWQDPQALRIAAAATMRRVLVDEARARKTWKRGRGARRVPVETLDQLAGSDEGRALAGIVLDDALKRLAASSPRRARIARLHVASGLELPRIAALLGVSLSTIEREWRSARVSLAAEGKGRLGRGGRAGPRLGKAAGARGTRGRDER